MLKSFNSMNGLSYIVVLMLQLLHLNYITVQRVSPHFTSSHAVSLVFFRIPMIW